MKTGIVSLLLLAAIAGSQAQARAQGQTRRQVRRQATETRATETREMKILVQDTLGNKLPDVTVSASYRGRPGLIMAETDARGDRFFRVTETDTLDLVVYNQIFEIAVADTDSLLIVSRVESRASGLDAINYIDPVTVSARRQGQVNVGYGSLSPENMSSWGTVVDMSRSLIYPDMQTMLQGQLDAGIVYGNSLYQMGNRTLAGAKPIMIVVDGVEFGTSFAEFNEIYKPTTIASVFLDKFGTIYGSRGSGGVLFVTTKGYR